MQKATLLQLDSEFSMCRCFVEGRKKDESVEKGPFSSSSPFCCSITALDRPTLRWIWAIF